MYSNKKNPFRHTVIEYSMTLLFLQIFYFTLYDMSKNVLLKFPAAMVFQCGIFLKHKDNGDEMDNLTAEQAETAHLRQAG